MTLITIFYSSYLDIPASILQLLYFSAGYKIISCITQYCLVNSIWKSDDTNNLEDSNISKVEKDIKIEPDIEEKSRLLSDLQLNLLDQWNREGKIRSNFNWYFFRNGDSRSAEIAGIGGAVMGSLLSLLVCFLL